MNQRIKRICNGIVGHKATKDLQNGSIFKWMTRVGDEPAIAAFSFVDDDNLMFHVYFGNGEIPATKLQFDIDGDGNLKSKPSIDMPENYPAGLTAEVNGLIWLFSRIAKRGVLLDSTHQISAEA